MTDQKENCILGALNKQRINQLETNHAKLIEVVDKIRNRPPLWATIAISALLAAVSWLIK